jgi:SAM-dependent methyltransferase
MAGKPDYGTDSPGIVIGLLVTVALAVGCAFVFPKTRWYALLVAAYFLVSAVGMLLYSKSGKMGNRDRILDSIAWRGDELVLDAGCGLGLLVVAAARRLSTGKAVGVDIWLPGAITGNRPASVMENAMLEGVSDRIRLAAGDLRKLPFKEHAFDAVISNYVIHEVQAPAERQQLAAELVRILKPGGRIALVDFIFTKEYAGAFERAGMVNTRRDKLGGVGFWVGAIMTFGASQTYLLTSQKPSS